MLSGKSNWWEKGAGSGYMEGKLSFLDDAREWYQDADQVLYVGQAGGSDPANAVYEARRRDMGLDLRNKDYITVQGLNFFATRASLDGAHYSTLDGVSFDYVAVISRIANSWNRYRLITENLVEGDGVWVSGDHNTIQNCQINHSDGDGLTIMGAYNLVSRCWVRNTDLKGIDSAPIFISGDTNTVEWSTFQDTGRGGILHNEIFNFGYLTVDLGATYDMNTEAAMRSLIGKPVITARITVRRRPIRQEISKRNYPLPEGADHE